MVNILSFVGNSLSSYNLTKWFLSDKIDDGSASLGGTKLGGCHFKMMPDSTGVTFV